MRTSGSWRKVVEILLIGVLGCFVLAELFPLLRPDPPPIDHLLTGFNLKDIGLAMHNYHDKHGSFPPPAIYDKEGQPLLSWRVLLLPFLEEKKLYSQFHLDEPWDSPHNIALLPKIPKVYAPATGKPPQEPFATYYQIFVGLGAAFEDWSTFSFPSFTDGTSQTILVVEAAEPVPWTKPEDLPFAPEQPLPQLGISKLYGRGGLSKLGTHATFADGSVHFISRETDEKIIRALITRNGGEKIDPDKVP